MNWREYGSQGYPVHQSDLRRCPQATRLAYAGAVPDHRTIEQVVGTLAHEWCAIRFEPDEFIYETLGGDEARFIESLKRHFNNETAEGILWNRKVPEKELADLIEMVEAFRDRFPVTEATQTEVSFRAKLTDETMRPCRTYHIAGRIDRLDLRTQFDESTWIRVGDIKTSKPPDMGAANVIDIQLGMYALGCKSITGRWPDELGYLLPKQCIPYKRNGKRSDGSTYSKGDPKGDPFRSVTFAESDLPVLTAAVRERVSLFRMGRFPHTGLYLGTCARCEYRSTCHGELAGKQTVKQQQWAQRTRAFVGKLEEEYTHGNKNEGTGNGASAATGISGFAPSVTR